jgi:uroporphyrinogen decarboxylase
LGHETFYRAQGKERAAIWAGRRDEVVCSQKEDLVALVRALEWDIVPVWLTYSDDVDYRPRRFLAEDQLKWEDMDGNLWQAASETADAVCIGSPSITLELLDHLLQGPPPVDESQMEIIDYVMQELGHSHFIIARGWHAPSTWTDGSFPIPGEGLALPIDRFLVKLYDDPDAVHAILEAYTKRAIEYGKIMIEAGVDAVQINADYCMNTGPWLSPQLFGEFVLPCMRQHVHAFKDAGAYVLKHTDGKTWKLLDMMVATGIDALHGIQPSIGMDVGRLKWDYGQAITLFGAVDCDTLVRGRPSDVAREVEYCLKLAARGGGLVLTSSNSIQAGTPYENYMAMLETAKEKGVYPISL